MIELPWTTKRDRPDVLKGAAAGLLGGIAATWVMTQFQEKMGELMGDENGEQEEGREQEKADDDEPATAKAADAVAGAVLNRSLDEDEKAVGGNVMHYGFGMAMGGLYGALAEVAPQARAFRGAGYGTALWLAADEVAVPALGLADPPTEQPLRTHFYGLAAHLVYGVTAEILRDLIRRRM
jgi:putative membrane protein